MRNNDARDHYDVVRNPSRDHYPQTHPCRWSFSHNDVVYRASGHIMHKAEKNSSLSRIKWTKFSEHAA